MSSNLVQNDSSSEGEEFIDDNHLADDVIGNWKLVDLPVVQVVTGEENQQVQISLKAKSYRWRQQWKERGVGLIKILKDKTSKKCRLLMRADITKRILINHSLKKIYPFYQLKKLSTSNFSWTYLAYDSSDGTVQVETLALKFMNETDFENFKIVFEQSLLENENLQSLQNDKQQKLDEGKQEFNLKGKNEYLPDEEDD